MVEVVTEHGGWVNKFEGDGALCAFGAPDEHPDAATTALTAARELRRRLHLELDALDAAIGVSAGPVVAGIGAANRYEYTVIGDAVNEAARLTELARGAPRACWPRRKSSVAPHRPRPGAGTSASRCCCGAVRTLTLSRLHLRPRGPRPAPGEERFRREQPCLPVLVSAPRDFSRRNVHYAPLAPIPPATGV